MKNKGKGIIIDLIFLLIYIVIIFLFIYFGFDNIYKSRLVPTLLVLLSIPIFWGTIIASIMGKNTLGNKIINRKNK